MTLDRESRLDNFGADLMIVSHQCVVSTNQTAFGELARRGWKLKLLVPNRWRHDFASAPFRAEVLPELSEQLLPRPVALAGRPQRHIYLVNAGREIDRIRPKVIFCQEDPFSLAAGQWCQAAWRRGIPFGVKSSENLDRPLPAIARLIRKEVLRRAAFIAARSPSAATLVSAWGAIGRISIVPNNVPQWAPSSYMSSHSDTFTIGFAGRLVPEKGLDTLVGAVTRLPFPTTLLIAGDGPQRSWLERQSLGSGQLRMLTNISHAEMPQAYAQMDVLVLPSLTTPTWCEQFGRVLIEALWCGIPVVGSDSGEIPWVIRTTSGGRVFPEGDQAALAQILLELRASPQLRQELATQGRAAVERQFSVRAVADQLEDAFRPWCSAPRAEPRIP